jgi:hypothetical protein
MIVECGFEPGDPMQNAWLQTEALRALALERDALDVALTVAGEQGWLENGRQPGTLTLTARGFRVARGA